MKTMCGSASAAGRVTCDRVEPLDARGNVEADLAAEPRRPRPGGHDDGARVDPARDRLDAEDAALATPDPRHPGPLAHLGPEILRPAAETLDRRGRIGVPARRLEGGGAEVLDVREGLEVVELRGESATVSIPMVRSISTFRRSASAYGGATTFTKPVWVNTDGPPMISVQFRKTGKLANARRASHSLV